MNSVLKMMNFVLKMMNFVFKNGELCVQAETTAAAAEHLPVHGKMKSNSDFVYTCRRLIDRSQMLSALYMHAGD